MKPVQFPSPEGLTVRLLGTVEVTWRGRQLPPFPTRQAELLFAFLALHGPRLHARDVLTGTFWGDLPDETARKRLRTALWRVRATLDDVPTEHYLAVSRDRLGMVPQAPYLLDVHRFTEQVRTALGALPQSPCATRLAELQHAVDLYRGDLLEGHYEEWCGSDRDRLKTLYLDAVEHLMRCHSMLGAWSAALDCGHRILAADPLREQVHRDIMALYYLAGDRPRALRQFTACAEMLQAELGVDPMRSTWRLKDALETEDESVLAEFVATTA